MKCSVFVKVKKRVKLDKIKLKVIVFLSVVIFPLLYLSFTLVYIGYLVYPILLTFCLSLAEWLRK